MKRRIGVIATLILTGLVIVLCSYQLPAIFEVKLKNEEVVKSSRIMAMNEDFETEPVDAVSDEYIPRRAVGFSPEEKHERLILTAKKAFKDEVGIELTDSYASFGACGTNGGELTMTWEKMPGDKITEYYTAVFSDADMENDIGNLVEVSVMGNESSSIEENLFTLIEQANTAFMEYLGMAPSNLALTPYIELKNGKKRVSLTWQEYDESNDTINFFEAWYESVNKDNSEGDLVHLYHEITPVTNNNDITIKSNAVANTHRDSIPATDTVTKNMDGDDVKMLDAAKKYASELGYNIKDLIGQYMRQDGSLMIHCFTIEHDRFDQLSVILNEDGDLSGSAVGMDITNYIHDIYGEVNFK